MSPWDVAERAYRERFFSQSHSVGDLPPAAVERERVATVGKLLVIGYGW
jgi:hypothetical protein